MSDDLLALLDALPALDEQGGTLFVRDTDRGVANLFDVPETDALMGLVTAVPRLREALLNACTTVERLTRENEGLAAQVGEARRARDTARRDLDAVRRELAEGLATGEDDDLDALALAARACEAIDRLRAQVTSITTAVDALTSTERDDDRADAAQMRAGWRALTARSDALARGETTPSLDAIRAHDGAWLWTLTGDRTYGGGYVALTIADDGRVWGVGATPRTYSTPEEFAAWGAVRRWWRVAADGSLAVGEKVDAAPDVG